MVVDGQRHVKGLVTTRDLRFVDERGTVRSRMTPRERLVVHTGDMDAASAEELMRTHKVKKLPLINEDGTLRGLVTAKDLVVQRELPFATRDAQDRLRWGPRSARKATTSNAPPSCCAPKSTSSSSTSPMGTPPSWPVPSTRFESGSATSSSSPGTWRPRKASDFCWSVASTASRSASDRAAAATTRLNTNYGVPQAQALVESRTEAGGRVPLIADGGVKRHGAFVQALTFGGDSVMLGGMLAGTTETPGEVVQKPVVVPDSNKTVSVPFKVFRGMASLEAIVDRLDVEDAEAADVEALGAEGMEVSVPARGSVRPLLRDIIKHLCSAISYSGARSLAEMQEMFRKDPERYVIRLTESSRRESFDR